MLENETYAPLTLIGTNLKADIACARIKRRLHACAQAIPDNALNVFCPYYRFRIIFALQTKAPSTNKFSKGIVVVAFCPVYIKMLEYAEKLRGNATDAPPMFVAFFSFPRQWFREPLFSLPR